MYKKRYIKRVMAIFLGVVMALAAGSAVYAIENGNYHDFREGKISTYLPEGWTAEEIEGSEAIVSARPETVVFEGGQPPKYEQIMQAQDENGNSGLNFRIYYTSEDAQGDYIYFDDDEDEAEWYYENYGFDVVDKLYEEVLAWPLANAIGSSWTVSDPEFFKGQWNGFLAVNGEGNTNTDEESMTFDHALYLTAQMADDSKTVVHMLLVFYNDDNTALTEQQSKLAREIADEFYDYDYYNVMAGVKSEDSLWSSDLGMSSGDEMDTVMTILIGIVSILAPLGIIVGIIVVIAKRAAERSGRVRSAGKGGARSFSASFTGIGKTLDLGDAISKVKKRRAEKNSFSGQEQRMEKRTVLREKRAERRAEREPLQATERRSTMQMRKREAESAEHRYYDSLQTLLKSGLLTREEMRDMMERHERSKARQRNR